ncbi:DUF1206 domain-containing protein [Jatrophihabitans sp. YIM 134969]
MNPHTGTERDVSDQVEGQVRRGRRSPVGRALARVGMASRAVVYGALAVVVLQLAFGSQPDDADQAGALTALGQQPAGKFVLWLLVVGVAFYVLWRLSELVAGTSSGERDWKGRLKSGLEGVAYIPIAIISANIAAGDPGKAQQGDKYRTLSARVMQDWPAGRFLVGLVGVVVFGIGAYLASEGPRRSFRDDLEFHGNQQAEKVVVTLGVIGSTARGVVFALAGILVVAAAVTADPDKAGGVDAALRSVADESYGPYLLTVVAIGLLCYAAFAVGDAIWHKL